MTAAAVIRREARAAPGLRRLRRWRDMAGVAALIGRSFPRGMDRSGRRMLAEMRALGRAGFLGWLVAPLLVPSAAYAEGFVWEEAGSIIGNASLSEVEGFPGRFVLANVAVDADHRGRGIGRTLVEASIELARKRAAGLLLLQVEPDNHPAIHLYSDLGFRTLTTRTLWQARLGQGAPGPGRQDDVRVRAPTEWNEQWALAQRLHPEGLVWPYPLGGRVFRRTGRLGSFLPGGPLHWAWPAAGRPKGWMTARRTREWGGWRLILLVEPESQGTGEGPLLRHVLAALRGHARTVTLDLPAGAAEAELMSLGFSAERTLAWMARDWRAGGSPAVWP